MCGYCRLVVNGCSKVQNVTRNVSISVASACLINVNKKVKEKMERVGAENSTMIEHRCY